MCSYTNIVAASLYNLRVTSSLSILVLVDNEKDVLQIKLMKMINDSKSING
jgi:hypothetical protein